MIIMIIEKNGLILKLGNCVRLIWTQGWQRPASVSTTGAINEIFPLNFLLEIFPPNFYYRNISAQLLKFFNFCFYSVSSFIFFGWFKKFHKKFTRGVLHKQGESYTHVDGQIADVYIDLFVVPIFKSAYLQIQVFVFADSIICIC